MQIDHRDELTKNKHNIFFTTLIVTDHDAV